MDGKNTLIEWAENLAIIRNWTEKYKRICFARIRKHASEICDTPIGEIKPEMVADAVERIWHSNRRTAKELKVELVAIFRRAKSKKALGKDFDFEDLQEQIKELPKNGHKEEPRPSISHNRLPPIAQELMRQAQAGDQTSAAVLLLMLSGLRLHECVDADWSEFRLKVWTVPAARMKARPEKKTDHLIPITSGIDGLLATLPGYGDDSGPVFTEPMHSRKLSNKLRKTCCSVLNSDDPKVQKVCSEVTNHGLRRSLRNFLEKKTSISAKGAERCLAHTVGHTYAIEKHYNTPEEGGEDPDHFTERIAPMQQWSDFLLS